MTREEILDTAKKLLYQNNSPAEQSGLLFSRRTFYENRALTPLEKE